MQSNNAFDYIFLRFSYLRHIIQRCIIIIIIIIIIKGQPIIQ